MNRIRGKLGARGCRAAGRRWIPAAWTAALLAASTGWGDVREASLTIGRGWAVVDELCPARLARGEVSILIDDIPAEADLSTLIIGHRRLSIQLLDWHRVGTPSSTAAAGFAAAGTTVTWSAGRAAPAPEPHLAGPVRCVIRSPVTGERDLRVSYLVTGITWRAQYLIGLRGEPGVSEQPISVDFNGQVTIENRTSREFYEAAIYLAGGAEIPAAERRSGRGFLMLAEHSSLAEMWAPGSEDNGGEGIAYDYSLPDRATVSRMSETSIRLGRMERAPAQRLFVIAITEPGEDEGGSASSRHMIAFRNRVSGREGRHLPAGEVTVYAGARRQRILQKGRLPHTMANAELRIDLGPEPKVRGELQRFGQTPVSPETREERFRASVHNEFPRDVIVEFSVRPPYRTPWEVDGAGDAYDRVGNVLRFQPVVSGHSRHDINFRLLVRN